MGARGNPRRSRTAGVLLALLCTTPIGARAADPIPDSARGAQIAPRCLLCHGAALRMGDPPVSVPRLFNQNAAYIVGALHDYADGARTNAAMRAQAIQLDPQATADVAAYFAGQRMKPPPANASGPIPAEVVQVCSACHGETGLASMPEVAVLSGQYQDYLDHALQAYASQERRNGVMPAFARGLTDADRQQVAAYFARLGALRSTR
jgi:cytochrome c553